MSKRKTRKQDLPKPPSPMPWFFLGASMILGGLYAIFEGWSWAGWIALGLAPFVVAILPMEITDFLQRKRICEHIRRDFMIHSSESTGQDHSQFLSALHHGSHDHRHIGPAFNPNARAPWEHSDHDFEGVSRPTR